MTGLLFPICQTYFLDQTKTNGNVSVGPYPIRNCFHILQVFFFLLYLCHSTDILNDVYSVILTVQNTMQP